MRTTYSLLPKTFACALSLFAAACADTDGAACGGTLITVPEGGSGFSVPQLMAHAAAMGMSQREAETLIYLEGISPQATLKPGQTICLDGKPD